MPFVGFLTLLYYGKFLLLFPALAAISACLLSNIALAFWFPLEMRRYYLNFGLLLTAGALIGLLWHKEPCTTNGACIVPYVLGADFLLFLVVLFGKRLFWAKFTEFASRKLGPWTRSRLQQTN